MILALAGGFPARCTDIQELDDVRRHAQRRDLPRLPVAALGREEMRVAGPHVADQVARKEHAQARQGHRFA